MGMSLYIEVKGLLVDPEINSKYIQELVALMYNKRTVHELDKLCIFESNIKNLLKNKKAFINFCRKINNDDNKLYHFKQLQEDLADKDFYKYIKRTLNILLYYVEYQPSGNFKLY